MTNPPDQRWNTAWQGYIVATFNERYHDLQHDDEGAAKWRDLRRQWFKIYESGKEPDPQEHERLYFYRWELEQEQVKPNWQLLQQALKEIEYDHGGKMAADIRLELGL